MLKSHRSLKQIIPLMIMVAGLAVILLQSGIFYQFVAQSTRDSTLRDIRSLGSLLTQMATNHQLLADAGAFDENLQAIAAISPELNYAAIVDYSGMIIHATDPEMVGRAARELVDSPLLTSPENGNDLVDERFLEVEDGQFLLGLFTYVLPSHDTQVATAMPGPGVVMISHDRKSTLSAVQAKTLSVLLIACLPVIAAMVLLLFGISRIVSRPLEKLISAVRAHAAGDLSASANLGKKNELGEISSALDNLTVMIKERDQAVVAQYRFAQIAEEAVNEIYIADAETLKIIYANRAARENLGYSLEELGQLMPWDYVTILTEDVIREVSAQLRSSDVRFREFESEHIRKDGSRYPIFSSLQYIPSQNPPVYASIVQDITERRKQEQDLRLRDRAIEALDVGVCISDLRKPNTPIVYANERLCEMTGYSQTELLGQDLRMLQNGDFAQRGHQLIREALESGKPIQIVIQGVRKDGSHYMDEVAVSPIRNAEGDLTHCIDIHRDVTEKLQIEAQLHRSQKNESVGQLAGGVAHNINNILSVITGNLEFLKARVTGVDELEFINRVDSATKMGARLSSRLLSFASRGQLAPVVLDLNEHVLGAMELLSSTIGDNISLKASLHPELWFIRSDASEIEITVVNLVLNSRDAMPNGGEVEIRTENITVTEDDVQSKGVAQGEYVQLSVCDTGEGMPEGVREHIFDPFFSTKDQTTNTGLGLSSIYGFALQSGGNVFASSEVGRGTQIRVLLPRHHGELPANILEDRPARIEAVKLNHRILVVEDNEMVLEMTVQRLRTLGYDTCEAENGPEALKVLDDNNDIDLILTDVMMNGGMSGYDVAEWAQTNRPACKILLTTGFSAELAGHARDQTQNWQVLHKPYRLSELQESLNGMLK